MYINFVLPGPAFSINQAYSRDIRYKTTAYKGYAQGTLYRLGTIPGLLDMALDYKPGDTFFVKIGLEYPRDFFYNEKGFISAKTLDLTNCEKLLVDLIFGDTLKINDRNITRVTSTKFAGSSNTVHVTIIKIRKKALAR